MPSLTDLATFLFVVAVIALLAAYALGIERNIRKGNNAMRWMRDGLALIGDKTTLQWLGSSVAQMKIAKAKDPFRNAELLIVLEPRDVPFMWLLTRRQGRRDVIIFRAQLRAAPNFDLEAALPNAWDTGKSPLPDGKFTAIDGALANSMRADARGNVTRETVNALINCGGQGGIALVRLSVRRTVPNLEVHYRLPKENFNAAPKFFQNLRALSEMILGLS